MTYYACVAVVQLCIRAYIPVYTVHWTLYYCSERLYAVRVHRSDRRERETVDVLVTAAFRLNQNIKYLQILSLSTYICTVNERLVWELRRVEIIKCFGKITPTFAVIYM